MFTDLDGTLLDHDTYDWKPALPAIKLLKEYKFPLILNSSKTSSEIKLLRKKLANVDPYICENGALVFTNTLLEETTESDMEAFYFSKSFSCIKNSLNEIRKNHDFDMLEFSEIDIKTLMDLTGLNETDARNAKQREATEPLQWNDSNESLENFSRLLNAHNLTLTRGGRFYHVSSPVDKGEPIKWLINKYRLMEPETQWITAGLGDSFNDISMLEQVDYPVLIKNTKTQKPDVDHINNLIESKSSGPTGWNFEVLKILKTIKGTD